jgi:cytochrome c oxidase subunit 2
MFTTGGTPLFPQQASTFAGHVDALYLFLVAITIFFSLLIAGLIVVFAVKYRRRHPQEVGASIHGDLRLEIVWTVIPLMIAMCIFVWGASVYFTIARTPDEALDIYVVGKQWMWKFQHLDGQAEINELHIPVHRAVRLTMTSQDVIHSLFIPAFRVKNDVIPGRYRTLWFEATTPGRYHLFCAEYCGTKHSGMIGQIVVMEPADYQAWLTGGSAQGSLADAGQKLFQALACNTCHKPDSTGRGPILQGLFGKTVQLQDGSTAVVDESYVRESILHPQARITAGYQPIMPTFQGQVSEEGVLQLIEYIKSLAVQAQTQAPAAERR